MSARSKGCLTILTAFLCGAPALAQGRQVDPNIGHFYMARQQITITDDSPVIQNKVNGGGQQGSGSGGFAGGGAPSLPKAGWMPYSQSVPGLRTDLPATPNGVPQKPAQPKSPPQGQRAGRGGLLKTGSNNPGKGSGIPGKQAPPRPNPNAVQAYQPYKQYAPESPAAGSAALNSNSNVQGSVLHWARHRR